MGVVIAHTYFISSWKHKKETPIKKKLPPRVVGNTELWVGFEKKH